MTLAPVSSNLGFEVQKWHSLTCVRGTRGLRAKAYTLGDCDGLALFISPNGGKAWHFRHNWLGKQSRMSLGTYPELSLLDAYTMQGEARALIAKGGNPRIVGKQKRQGARLAGEYTFLAVYEKWLACWMLVLEAGRQSTLQQIRRAFKKDGLQCRGGWAKWPEFGLECHCRFKYELNNNIRVHI